MQPQSNRTSWPSIVLALVLVAAAGWLWVSRQWLVDVVQFYQYTPTTEVARLAEEATFTQKATFMFYATKPSVEDKEAFNRNCQRQEASSPILGCYFNGGIFIYDIKDERLAGIKVVTAAHEMLHAEYDRLSGSKKQHIDTLLQQAYERLKTDDLERRMDYYAKAEPGQSLNELHSILGSEFQDLGQELNDYYENFFTNRSKIVALNQKVEEVFNRLKTSGDALVKQINTLASEINAQVASYNQDIETLNKDIASFNAQANGGFRTQASFQYARSQLVSRGESLALRKESVQTRMDEFNRLKSELELVNAESSQINRSLDSTLSDVPEVN